jgi:ribosomal protein L37E
MALTRSYETKEEFEIMLCCKHLIIIIIIILTAMQDQVILKRNYKKYILKKPNVDEVCRRCGKEPETIQHITAACGKLAPTEYIKRHDGVAKVIYQKLAEAAELR